MKSKTWQVAALFVVTAHLTVSAMDQNLLLNPGFELIDFDQPAFWQLHLDAPG